MADTNGKCYAQYKPSLVIAIIMVVSFALASSVHFFQLIRSRTWFFIPFALGGMLEAVGYVGRSIGAAEYPDCSTIPYILNNILPLMATAQFIATMYMFLGRIIRETGGEALSVIRTAWLTKLFSMGDIISGIIQAIGGIMLSSATSQSARDRGEDIITLGLIIQLAVFLLFMIAVIHYDLKLRSNPTDASWNVPWDTYVGTLYWAGGLILIRNIFRVSEYVEGDQGEIRSNETYLYLFDAALMLAVMIIFSAKHPGSLSLQMRPIRPGTIDAFESSSFLLREIPRK